jgi:hypothetical protein
MAQTRQYTSGYLNRRFDGWSAAAPVSQPVSQGTVGGIFTDNNDALIVDIGFDQRQYIRMPARLNPEIGFSFDGAEIDLLIERKLQRDVGSGDGRAPLSQPYHAKGAFAEFANQNIRAYFNPGAGRHMDHLIDALPNWWMSEL